MKLCTRCPKVGRTDESGQRQERDSSHYYCRLCRAEYAKERYVPVPVDGRKRPNSDLIANAVKKLEKLHTFMWQDGIDQELLKMLQVIIDDLKTLCVEKVEDDSSWTKERRGPAKQTIADMLQGLRLAEQFENQSQDAKDNVMTLRAEIRQWFPEYVESSKKTSS